MPALLRTSLIKVAVVEQPAWLVASGWTVHLRLAEAVLDQCPHAQWTVHFLCWTIARLGSILARTSDGLPGWQTGWCGLISISSGSAFFSPLFFPLMIVCQSVSAADHRVCSADVQPSIMWTQIPLLCGDHLDVQLSIYLQFLPEERMEPPSILSGACV